jgi:predicted nucleic acid-binding protein
MIVVDTSAWVELLRKTGSAVHLTLRELIVADAPIAVTEAVVFEVLAGARSDQELEQVRNRILAFPVLHLDGLDGFEKAAALYRACRTAGETLSSLVDCLVAVPAIEAGATVLATDRDFEVLARHTPLRLEPLAA